MFRIFLHSGVARAGINFGWGANFLWHFECTESRGSVGGAPFPARENFEFLDSLQCYFTYFRMWFEEKLQPQKVIFKLP